MAAETHQSGSVTSAIRWPVELHAKAAQQAQAERRSLNAMVLVAVERYLKSQKARS
jgi:predicted HicB family RNase H-like nuclease